MITKGYIYHSANRPRSMSLTAYWRDSVLKYDRLIQSYAKLVAAEGTEDPSYFECEEERLRTLIRRIEIEMYNQFGDFNRYKRADVDADTRRILDSFVDVEFRIAQLRRDLAKVSDRGAIENLRSRIAEARALRTELLASLNP